ncbi:MAG: endonuclease/exonuclease/phosphatase family protein [Acidimicrobiaceae bacterium]|nr:endonuclease/exonuclease/phosphatase family protein [Acidimicrobiaceae bacterium]
MACVRLAEQFIASPAVDLVLVSVGVVAFLPLIPLLVLQQKEGDPLLGGRWRLGLLLGFAVDTVIKGGFSTLDTSWHPSVWADVVATVLTLSLLGLAVWRMMSHARASSATTSATGSPPAAVSPAGASTSPTNTFAPRDYLPLLTVGPLLFLEMLFFQNVAQQTALTGWPQPFVLAWVVGLNVAGLWLAVSMVGRLLPAWVSGVTTVGATVLLMFTVVVEWSGVGAAGLMFAGHLAVIFLLMASWNWNAGTDLNADIHLRRMLSSNSKRAVSSDKKRAFSSHETLWGLQAIWIAGFGTLCFMVLSFAYYARYDIDIIASRSVVLVVAAGLVATPGLVAVFGGWFRRQSESQSSSLSRPGWKFDVWVPAVATVFLLVPLALATTWTEPSPVCSAAYIYSPGSTAAVPAFVPSSCDGGPVRVMTYNIHQGFDTSGRLDLEALAETIEAESSDIIALQEVSRGWAINGSVDTLVWLSRRLDMPYVWGPAADSVWGNAILSRYPVIRAEYYDMPNNHELFMDRGFIDAAIDVGDVVVDGNDDFQVDPIRLIATHFHAYSSEGRIPQTQAVLQQWNGADRTILLGDLNGRPDDPEIEALVGAGLKDAYEDAGASGDSFTYHSKNPYKRIDYIWVSSDLTATDYSVPSSQASDHFPVTATVQ